MMEHSHGLPPYDASQYDDCAGTVCPIPPDVMSIPYVKHVSNKSTLLSAVVAEVVLKSTQADASTTPPAGGAGAVVVGESP